MTPRKKLNSNMDIKEILKDMADEVIEDIGNNITSTNSDPATIEKKFKRILKKKLDELPSMLRTKMEKWEQELKEMGGFSNLLKMAWNFEEETIDVLTFDMVIMWTKKNFNSHVHSGGCLVADDNGKTYHLFFIDKKDKALLSGADRHKMFYAKKIDDDLQKQLANKKMLVIR